MNNAMVKVGDNIYVRNSFHISRGSDDVVGGLAEVTEVKTEYGSVWVSVKEHPGHSYNWDSLKDEQEGLKKEFGDKRAYPDPDVDTPWIAKGDYVGRSSELDHDVDGHYIGEDIW